MQTSRIFHQKFSRKWRLWEQVGRRVAVAAATAGSIECLELRMRRQHPVHRHLVLCGSGNANSKKAASNSGSGSGKVNSRKAASNNSNSKLCRQLRHPALLAIHRATTELMKQCQWLLLLLLGKRTVWSRALRKGRLRVLGAGARGRSHAAHTGKPAQKKRRWYWPWASLQSSL